MDKLSQQPTLMAKGQEKKELVCIYVISCPPKLKILEGRSSQNISTALVYELSLMFSVFERTRASFHFSAACFKGRNNVHVVFLVDIVAWVKLEYKKQTKGPTFTFVSTPIRLTRTRKSLLFLVKQTRTLIETAGHRTALNKNDASLMRSLFLFLY